MSKQKVKNKIYALIIAVTLFVSVNNLSQAEEKSGIIGKELADSSTTTSTTGTEEQNDEISDVKIRYSQDEIDMANQLSEKVKKKRKKEKRARKPSPVWKVPALYICFIPFYKSLSILILFQYLHFVH